MWRISFWLFFSIGYIIINNSIKAGFNPYRPNRLHFLPYFNPRSPCGERLAVTYGNHDQRLQFQSTLPVRGATTDSITGWETVRISIHAPRAGSDRENSDHYPDFQIILVWLFVFGRT